MAASIMLRLSQVLNNFENSLAVFVSRLFPPGGPGFAVAGVDVPRHSEYSITPTDDDSLFKNGFVWFQVPRNRRTLERRNKKRFGLWDYHWKFLRVKKNLISCIRCGHWHEPAFLCPNCYNQALQETKEIRKRIEETLKLDPVDTDVIVLYENDTVPEHVLQGKRIIEMEKPRPQWFSRNLMQPSTEEVNEKVKDVKPLDLA